MTLTSLAAGLAVVALVALAVGCAETSASSPAPNSPPKAGPTPVNPASPPLAKLISVTPAEPVLPSSNGPRLAVDVEAADFGEVPFETIVAFSINLKNVVSAPLLLELPFIRVTEGC